MRDIYVILIDGNLYRKDSAIRTYKTRERAEEEARKIGRYWSYRDSKLEVGRFTAVEVTEVSVARPDYSAPCPYIVPEKEDAN
ncbi:hypothetical protein [Paenibacillus sp. YN15]|uniref:hypothetical protein n=1 Tax=Paenibacillus sp. YN15 TaxID=1742774 RepID=UPI000DCD55E8|nr:hypothetical protein [Paenibacillus sp. YN15]RAU96817.1 hypothetical protein DQG13_19885 [Paenibacillus sp. YN15]